MQQLLLLLLTLLLLSVQFWKDLTVSVNLLVPPGSAWVLLSFEALLSEGCTSTAPSPLRSQTRSPEGTQKNHVPPEPSGPAVPGLQPLSSSGSCCSSGRRFWFLDRPIRTTGKTRSDSVLGSDQNRFWSVCLMDKWIQVLFEDLVENLIQDSS